MKVGKGGIVIEDGPGAGTYSARRAPYWLRVVVDRHTGEVDLLDQLGDEPGYAEDVHVYEAVAGTISPDYRLAGIIICPPPGASGRYRYRPDVDGERFRSTIAWRAWARSQPTAMDDLVDAVTGEPMGAARP